MSKILNLLTGGGSSLIDKAVNGNFTKQDQATWEKTINKLLPEGSPPYKVDEAPDDSSWSDLHREYKMFAYFFKGPYSSMKQSKRESMFVQLLEKLHPSEAALVCAAKDKSIKYKGITKIMIKDAFPNLLKL